jgi:hypothetical protein
MFVRTLILSAVLIACSKEPRANGAPSPASPPSKAPASPPSKAPAPPTASGASSRATTIMNAQVAAINTGEEAKLVDTFSDDAVVLVPDPRAAHGETTGLPQAIARLAPHDSLKSIKVDKLVAGANAGAVWWSAELTVTTTKTTTIRVTELATSDAKWKVVAGAFAAVRPAEAAADSAPIKAGSTTAAGVLTPLSGDIAKLDAALTHETVVFGTDKGEVAYGDAAAHAMLKKWSKLAFAIDGKPREMHGKDWAFAITNVNWQQPKEKVPARMSCLVIANPTAVVAVQYTAN